MAENKVKTIGVLTSGGDAPGMNAAIRAVVRRGLSSGLKVKGIQKGYNGLLNEEIIAMTARDVSDTIERGGTILYTARCAEFRTAEGQQRGAEICRKHGIDGLVVIGGDGSYQGAYCLSKQGIGVVGVPGTIDLDIGCTEYTIGFDTAVNIAVEAIDRIADTSEAHSCFSVVEVMGRRAGFIALWSGIAGSARAIFADSNTTAEQIVDHLRKYHFTSGTIVLAEGAGKAEPMAEIIERELHVHTRANVLAFIQRGGNPTAKDRVYGSMMGAYAVDLIKEGKNHHLVCVKHDELCGVEISEGMKQTKECSAYLAHLGRTLSCI